MRKTGSDMKPFVMLSRDNIVCSVHLPMPTAAAGESAATFVFDFPAGGITQTLSVGAIDGFCSFLKIGATSSSFKMTSGGRLLLQSQTTSEVAIAVSEEIDGEKWSRFNVTWKRLDELCAVLLKYQGMCGALLNEKPLFGL